MCVCVRVHRLERAGYGRRKEPSSTVRAHEQGQEMTKNRLAARPNEKN